VAILHLTVASSPTRFQASRRVFYLGSGGFSGPGTTHWRINLFDEWEMTTRHSTTGTMQMQQDIYL
jgi:hypothetical protein